MQNNVPVTGHERVFPDDEIIVSKTDLQGRITYVNKAFVDISGFTHAELIGQPHNIVRHPDMPSQAYRDFWNTLKSGKPWVGLVKNRCKNGDHYWVEAHATPIWEAGQITGYLSVRHKARRAQIDEAEKVYARFRQGQAQAFAIVQGQVFGAHLGSRLKRRFMRASISFKIILASALSAFVVMALLATLLGARMGSTLADQGRVALWQNLDLIKGMIEVRASALGQEASRLNRLFSGLFAGPFSVETSEAGPVLISASGLVLNGRAQEVDRFTQDSGAVATVFARAGDDFLRIATSLKREDGSRATGTFLGQAHPAHALLMAGQSYVGKAVLFGRDYYTAYTPVKNRAGEVVGVLFIGMDVSAELAELRTQVSRVKVGDTGYFFVLDARPGPDFGTAVIHPARQGSSLLGARDAQGREFIREMLVERRGEIYYPWSNPELGEHDLREKIAIFDIAPTWEWLIGGGTYMDEFDAPAKAIRHFVWGATALVVVLLVLLISWLVGRLITRPLQQQVLPAFRNLSAGKYDNPLEVTRNDEIGQVLQGLETMQNRLGFEVTETKRVADEMARIKIALDSVSTGVMIADQDRTVIYANPAVQRLLSQAQAAIQARAPQFDASQLVGMCIDRFHKNPSHQAQLLSGLKGMHTAKVELGGRIFMVSANPVISATGERLGSVAEWQDRTLEVALEHEVQSIVCAAAQGDFSARLSLEGKEGFFKNLAAGLNPLLDTTASGLTAVATMLTCLSQGKLNHTIEGEYHGLFARLRDDANATAAQLTQVVRRIQEASEAINIAAREIAFGNTDLSSRTEAQASSLEQTAASMEELTSTVKQNADSAREANEMAVKAQRVAEQGGQVMQDVVHTMSQIHLSSRKISDIISVIDSIAFQTNILALNAAVEAARAGEQGRGFAVVATEVRNLAQRSAGAAKEIKSLISDSVDTVNQGAGLVDRAGKTMEDVVQAIKKVADIMATIAQASREQSMGIEQIGMAVAQMDEMTQQNAALVEEAAAAAESLEEQALALGQAVSVFQTASLAPAPVLHAPQQGRQAPRKALAAPRPR